MLLSPLLRSTSWSYSSYAGFPHRYPSGFPFIIHILHEWICTFLWLKSLALNLWFPNNLQPTIFSRAPHLHIQLPSEYLHLYVWQDPKCNLSKAELNIIPLILASPLVFYITVTGATALADISTPNPSLLSPSSKTPILFCSDLHHETLELQPWCVLGGWKYFPIIMVESFAFLVNGWTWTCDQILRHALADFAQWIEH